MGKSLTGNEIRIKNTDKVPILLQSRSSALKIKKFKYLVARDCTMGDFFASVRKQCTLDDRKAMFFFCGDALLAPTLLVGDVDEEYKQPDGFLYVKVCEENVFGSHATGSWARSVLRR